MKTRQRMFAIGIPALMLMTACGGGSTEPKEPAMEEATLIPMEDFFRKPEKASFNLSPDGGHLAYMAPWNDRMNIYVQQIGEPEAKRITSVEDRDIAGYFWATENRLVYLKDHGGDENFYLVAVDRDGQNEVALTDIENVRTQIIDDLEDNPAEMIIGLNQRDPRIFDAYRINIETGEMELIAENPGTYVGWMTDHDGKLRIAYEVNGTQTTLYHRTTEADEFEQVITTDWKESLDPLFFTFDNKNLYCASNINRDKSAIVIYDLEAKKEAMVMFQHEEVDVSNLNYSNKRKVLTSISWTTDKTERKILDETFKAIYEDLQAQLPGYEIGISSTNDNEDKFIVRTYSDRTRGTAYFYDLQTKGLIELAELSPWLDEDNMAEMKPIQYQSRDGLTINGYLTLPKGVEHKNLPVVVNPHGGPSSRDYWGFNSEAQFLANRGYAVLQVNFRGSTGYGREFWTAGFKKWGKEMQDDITDGVHWLVEQGIADSNRIGIYGASYGGYATLAGLCFTPDLYACGVDYVGVSNLFTIIENIPPYWEPLRAMLFEQIGDPVADSAHYNEVSPVFHADKIKAPLFIAQGANDPRVKKIESDQMVEALRERGVEVQYMVKDNEGHGFRNQENQYDFYRAMEAFLAEHLNGKKYEKVQDPVTEG